MLVPTKPANPGYTIIDGEIKDQQSDRDPLVHRYTYDYLSMDSKWGFWDETGTCFYAGYETEAEAIQALNIYVAQL